MSRSGAGWLSLSALRMPGCWLPREPRAASRAGLKVYQPMRARARAAWLATRLAAHLGGLRLLAPGPPPPAAVLDLVARHLPRDHVTAVMRRCDHRFVVITMSRTGQPSRVAKVALSAADELALRREADAIAAYGGWLVPPLAPPRVLASERGLLLFDAVDWQLQWRPWRLDSSVAAALGTLHRRGRSGDGRGLTHGDCTPWNLLRRPSGWVLLDWELAGADAPAWFDLLHFLVQAARHLGRPSQRAVVDGVTTGRGWIGRAVRAYAEAAELDSAGAAGHLRAYLWARAAQVDLRTPHGRAALVAAGRDPARPLGTP
jgi:hypothetical protein